MRATISRAEVQALCRSLGADLAEVSSVQVTAQAVTVIAESGTTVIPVVGADGAERVAMRHPRLPGRLIHVRPRGVGQRAMAGWEVAPPPGPPPTDPPPHSGTNQEAPAEPGASSSPAPRRRKATKKQQEDG
ncbi:hypothetical protein [Actinomadura sp. SCN-SB]|uniref:hypothetical protein n=1 Tax=Actinomadura sp. SCN-SB TaxID=3373092 RepID=UPI0037513DF8